MYENISNDFQTMHNCDIYKTLATTSMITGMECDTGFRSVASYRSFRWIIIKQNLATQCGFFHQRPFRMSLNTGSAFKVTASESFRDVCV